MVNKKFFFTIGLLTLSTLTTAAENSTPPVTITIKNLSSEIIEMDYVRINPSVFILHGSPQPSRFIYPNQQDTYTVSIFYYMPANDFELIFFEKKSHIPQEEKRCHFRAISEHPNNPIPIQSEPTSSVLEATRGAICTAQVTSYNQQTGAWAVEFTMK